ncbi:DUF4011 domain-containing protein [Janthinobacterium sp.]|uniref:DUF4011 domain-containing protein n=1 Tax=Janthinobacterium sp. TaxID=1871054 RepID=UPI00293D4DD9|nr:DUF4011 domain-containing protein [Janthinobacterium sp.]
MTEQAPLLMVLENGLRHGGMQNDDVLALVLPLLREVAALHDLGRVAALDGPHAYRLDAAGALALLLPQGASPSHNGAAIERLQAPASSALRVVGATRLSIEAEDGCALQDLDLADAGPAAAPTRPAYLCGYHAWERGAGHHDAGADILCLGQVLASLSCGLDFTRHEELARFVAHRENLFRLRERLHPVIAAVIVEMTALNRHERARELPSVIRRLESYREQPLDLAIARVAGGADSAARQRRAVQTHLRDRLFDLSRRNRLLYFKPSQASTNLTVASVPLVVDLNSIAPDQLCVWHGRFATEVLDGQRVALSRWLRFEDQPYLPGALDRIIQEARRDRAEYGFSQLSLVLAFLRWHNLKDARDERITSPLLLLPVELTRKKGVRDQYVLQADTTEAQVNPVLRQHLRQLYGIVLPASVDLRAGAIAQFHAELQQQIAATEPGVQLRLVTQPEIELIHQRATQRLEQFRRRQRVRPQPGKEGAEAKAQALDYSYSADDFRPLGLKLFHERVRRAALPLRGAVGGRPEVRHPQMAAEPAEQVERATFALRESQGNPYLWDMDLSNVTLGNFNYRKMSLVRDYTAMLDEDMDNPAFERVFSLQPRGLDADAPAPLPKGEQWAVVPADATQTSAVALARSGASYIIQGPPGTGKSQTITNLIADYVGRGKRVLFVCEKRAAIDVVFHRLQQQGLDELCCMIHDSQADKKEFVLNLKQTYEHWLAAEDEFDAVARARQALVNSMEQDGEALRRFDAAMCAAPADLGATLRELLHRLVALHGHAAPAQLTARQSEALPPYAAWLRHPDLAQRLQRSLRDSAGVDSLARHVFAHLGAAVIRHDRPLNHLAELGDRAEALLDRCDEALCASLPEQAAGLGFRAFAALVEHARRYAALAGRGQLALLDPRSALSLQFDAGHAALAASGRALAKAAEQTTHWRDKLDVPDAQSALAQLQTQEASPLRWLRPSWWRLRGQLERRYDFKQHAVRPPARQVLAALIAEQRAQAMLDEERAALGARFGGADPHSLMEELDALREAGRTQAALAQFQHHLLASDAARGCVERLAALGPDCAALAALLEALLPESLELPLDALGALVRELREQADSLPELLPLLRELGEADPLLACALRSLALTPQALEYAIAHAALEGVYRRESWLPRFDGAALARHVGRLGADEQALLGHNASLLRAAVRRRFRANVQRSTLAASQLDAEGKLFKKAYAAGRRELEHEFGKSMRYKAIRELASADSGRVLRDMKPIWLMSPLSVSDTLPLTADLFDVVIFDEASQIPMEEAVPALYRAPQVIIVGDEMQLPPTSFFASSRGADEDGGEDEDERLAVTLDADSLLNQGARNLPATLLAWHYRSRYESLIGFSNATFYAGKLYTIPDRSLPAAGLGEILVRGGAGAAADAPAHTDALLQRAISFHHLHEAVYAERRNEAEAAHIAQLLRELLARDTGLSIGIVAFSEAQQSEIEAALEALAATDSEFAARLDAEYLREENGQFCGLIVKNLENIQGDERDVIILSICYGRNAEGRMLMNFGPINQRGGEKRLNVIFSRARHHMAVVSSIRHAAITNDYNEGAAALKQFLRYAECCSRGERETAQAVLENLNPLAREALGDDGARDEVALQLGAALRERGHVVDSKVGQSRFRCDLGIRAADGGQYALGIMIDTAAHYANRDIFERYVSRPRILRAFGWRTLQVIASDWFHDRAALLERIERAMQADAEPEPRVDDTAAAEATPAPAATAPLDDADREEATAPAETPATMASPSPAASSARRFEFIEGTARKFWSVECTDSEVTIRFGRIGTQGQTQLKQFASAPRARQEAAKLADEKLRKGYKEVTAQGGPTE